LGKVSIIVSLYEWISRERFDMLEARGWVGKKERVLVYYLIYLTLDGKMGFGSLSDSIVDKRFCQGEERKCFRMNAGLVYLSWS
jgi:hypothetical protein